MSRIVAVLLSAFLAIALAGCSAHFDVHLDPRMAVVPGATKAPLRVALVITPAQKQATYSGFVDFPGEPKDYSSVFDIGQAMESASWQMLTQYFADVELLSQPPGADEFDLVVEPTYVSMQPKMRRASLSTAYTAVDLTMRIKASRQGQTILDREVQALNHRGAETQGNAGLTSSFQTAANNALSALLSEWVSELRQSAEVRRIVAATTPSGAKATTGVMAPVAAAPSPPRLASQPAVTRFPRGPERADDVAVIIGNADYAKLGRDIPDVRPAYADAEGARLYATQALGVKDGNVIFLKDATGAQMTRVFGSEREHRGQLFDWVKPGRSRVFVYYAGHGAPGRQGESPYLVPVDADAARIEINGYPLKQLYDNLGRLPAASVTVVLEACFSGQSQGGPVIGSASPVFFEVKAPPVPSTLTVITAGAAGQMASWEPDGNHGLFTRHFLEAMSGKADADKDGKVSLAELDRYLKDTLTYYARRHYGRDQQAQIVQGGAR